jgi:hypothetical protein
MTANESGTAATGTRSEQRLSAYSWFALGLLTFIYMISMFYLAPR